MASILIKSTAHRTPGVDIFDSSALNILPEREAVMSKTPEKLLELGLVWYGSFQICVHCNSASGVARTGAGRALLFLLFSFTFSASLLTLKRRSGEAAPSITEHGARAGSRERAGARSSQFSSKSRVSGPIDMGAQAGFEAPQPTILPMAGALARKKGPFSVRVVPSSG